MRIATWNVHKLYRAGAINELGEEMDMYKIDVCMYVCAVQESRWPGKGTMVENNHMIFLLWT
jgi:hypothetical protein